MKEPQRSYKVWLEIEEFNPEADTYRDLDTPGGAIAEFGTYRQARMFVESLNQMAEALAPSSKRRPAAPDYEPTRPMQLVESTWSKKGDGQDT